MTAMLVAVAFLLCCIVVYGVHLLAWAPGLRHVRWWLIVIWCAVFIAHAIVTLAVPSPVIGLNRSVSWSLVFCLLLFISAAIGLYPGFILKPMALPERKPIGEMVIKIVGPLLRVIVIYIVFGVFMFTAHFAGWTIPWLLFVLVLLFWIWSFQAVIRKALHDVGEPQRTFFHLFGTWHWSETPYNRKSLRSRSNASAVEDAEKEFDIFVSYKSEDIAAVRPVVDLLLASGYKVWFAEYAIPLTEWDRAQSFIDQGTRQSRYGLLFTSDLYIRSWYCQMEVEQLLEHCGPGRVLEVKIRDEPETHAHYPDLDQCPAIDYDDCPSALDLIERETDLVLEAPFVSPDQGRHRWYRDPALGFKLDMAGWSRSQKRSIPVASSPDGTRNLSLTRNLGGHRVTLNLNTIDPKQTERLLPEQGQPINDRRLFDGFRYIAQLSLLVRARDCTGVHLVFCGGLGQMTLSYWNARAWQREYSVLLPHPQTRELKEFRFTFGFEGPFETYCKYAHLMDQLVMSLEW